MYMHRTLYFYVLYYQFIFEVSSGPNYKISILNLVVIARMYICMHVRRHAHEVTRLNCVTLVVAAPVVVVATIEFALCSTIFTYLRSICRRQQRMQRQQANTSIASTMPLGVWQGCKFVSLHELVWRASMCVRV